MSLADITDVPAASVKDWLLIFGFLLGVAGAIMALMRKMPQPLRTAEEKEWATANGVKALSDRVDQIERTVHSLPALVAKELREMERTMAKAGEERAADIHERINPLAKEIHELRGAVTEATRLLHELANRNPRRT